MSEDETAHPVIPEQASVEPAAPAPEEAKAPAVDTSAQASAEAAAPEVPAAAPEKPVEAPAVEEVLPEPPNNPPPSLDPTVERPAVLPGHEGYVDQIGKMRLEIDRLETENARLTQELARFQPVPSV